MLKRLFSLCCLMTLTSLLLTTAPTKTIAQTEPIEHPQESFSHPISKTTTADQTTPAIYIVQLQEAPLATYRGDIAQLQATSPKATQDQKLNTTSRASQDYLSYLQQKRDTVLTAVKHVAGSTIDVVYTYDAVLNGIALRMTAEQAEQVAQLPGVVKVEREQIASLLTDTGPSFIGATQADFAPALFQTTLSGKNETTPNTSAATGSGVFTYDEDSSALTFNITMKGTTATGAHIHQGAAGVDGSIVIDLLPRQVSPGVFIGSTTITTPAVKTALLNNNGLYVNIHSAAYPSGEIRGQINATRGEGMLVGVIDTGINYSHASFADIGGDGYDHSNPRGSGNYVGVCDKNNTIYQSTFVCNDKLIGAWTWPSTKDSPNPNTNAVSPADDDGHGSHTAATAAGNILLESSVNSVPTGKLSGVAPHANIIAYDACNTASGCPSAALIASIDQAVKDNVDVINYSIGADSSDPWDRLDGEAFLNAFEAGVLASVAAGNDGPSPQTINTPSNAPWVMSVAASTHNRIYTNGLTDLSGGNTAPPTDLTGVGFSAGLTPTTTIVYAGSAPYNNPLCNSFGSGVSLANLIVVCDRGTINRVAKAQNVANAGGAGFVLANTAANQSLNGDPYPIPGVHINSTKGAALKTWLAAGAGHKARIIGQTRTISASNGDIMAGFSSRGPDATTPSVLKPDVAAPGVDILAASLDQGAGNEFYFNSGTSMATPHNAGAATLLRSLHPDWSVAEIQSALMTTAIYTPTRKEDGVTPTTPFDRGSGRIDVQRAAHAGLVMDETTQNFNKANPTLGGDPRKLNRANAADYACILTCTWTRTLSNTLATSATWTVSMTSTAGMTLTVEPANFTLPVGGSKTITITANVRGLPYNNYVFGQIILKESANLAPDAILPVAAQPVISNLPTKETLIIRTKTGTKPSQSITAIAISNLTLRTYGLVKGEPTITQLKADTDNSSFYDKLDDGVYLQQVTVVSGTQRLAAEITASTAPDIDIHLFQDQNGDKLPQATELVCKSASGIALEKCNLINPTPGLYLVLVHNFAGSGPDVKNPVLDTFTLITAVVPQTDAKNLSITGPTTVEEKKPFTVNLAWNIPTLKPGDRWYGAFDLGTAESAKGNLGVIPVDLQAELFILRLPVIRR